MLQILLEAIFIIGMMNLANYLIYKSYHKVEGVSYWEYYAGEWSMPNQLVGLVTTAFVIMLSVGGALCLGYWIMTMYN